MTKTLPPVTDHRAPSNTRDVEKFDYDAVCKGDTESVDALRHANGALKEPDLDREHATSLVEVAVVPRFSLVPKIANEAIEASLQSAETQGRYGVRVPERRHCRHAQGAPR